MECEICGEQELAELVLCMEDQRPLTALEPLRDWDTLVKLARAICQQGKDDDGAEG